MKKIFISLASIIICVSSYAQTNTSKWLIAPLTIDGDNADWGGRPSCYESECAMFYELKNDSNYLFLLFEIAGKQSQTKFMQAGFEVAIKIKTKPKLNASINFLAQQNQERSARENEGLHNPNNLHQGYLLNSSYADVSGFLKTNEKITRNINGNQAFTYNIGWNDLNNMLVEIRIPMSEVFGVENVAIDYTKIPISLTCILNAMEHSSGEKPQSGGSDTQSGVASGGGRSGGGGGRSGGGGSHGGGGGGGGGSHGGGGRSDGQRASSSDMQTMSIVQSFKAKYVLSKGK